MIRIVRQNQRTIAICALTAWTLLFCLQTADAIEDAVQGPEPMDIQVAQALAIPLDYSPHLVAAPSNVTAAMASILFNLPTVDLPYHAFLMYGDPDALLPEQLSLRSQPLIFALFSVYRL